MNTGLIWPAVSGLLLLSTNLIASDAVRSGLPPSELANFKLCMAATLEHGEKKGLAIQGEEWNCSKVYVYKERGYIRYAGRLSCHQTGFDPEYTFTFTSDNHGRLLSGPAIHYSPGSGLGTVYRIGDNLTSSSFIGYGMDLNWVVSQFRNNPYVDGPNLFRKARSIAGSNWNRASKSRWLVNEMVIQAIKVQPRDHRGSPGDCKTQEGSGHRTRPDSCEQEQEDSQEDSRVRDHT